MMKLIPFDRYTLLTGLNIAEINERLVKEVDQIGEGVFSFGQKTTYQEERKVLKGVILSEHFHFRRISFRPRDNVIARLSGKLITIPEGTEISVKVELLEGAKIFLAVWLGLFLIIGVLPIITSAPRDTSFFNLILPLMLLVFFILIIQMYNEERKYLKNTLLELLEGEEL